MFIVETDQPRNLWRLGRVEVQESQDGLVRKATVKLGNKLLDKKGIQIEKTSVLHRPVQVTSTINNSRPEGKDFTIAIYADC